MHELEDALREFLAESHDNLDQLERDLVELEKSPRDGDRLASIFRTVHTIKGTCGFFEFRRLGNLAHAGENLLSRLRDGELHLSPAIASALLALIDALRLTLTHVEKTGGEPEADHSALIALLTRLQEVERLEEQPAIEEVAPSLAEETAPGVSEGTIRVAVGLLDRLMDLVGELVLARNQVLAVTAAHADASLGQVAQRLNLITSELQEGVMRTRMQPIGSLWNRLPRVVRDLARACGKEVRLGMEGAEIELDRSILEAIRDPLTHLVRNAIDHGLETPDERRRSGKAAAGLLNLWAFHEGGRVHIEVSDDGRGLDPERIRRRAVERGLVSGEQTARMDARELNRLIFLPGFSTAERVTDLSGRGVGMDVVRTNVEKIGGLVDVTSQPGRGTTVTLTIPLTLAIVPALLVSAAGGRYAIPQVNLLELVRLDEACRRKIEYLYGAPVYRLRGNLLPLVALNGLLGVEGAGPCAEGSTIVVLQVGSQPFGLLVDGVGDTQEIVVKPLAPQLRDLSMYAGATILGDGRVALILDVAGLAERARVVVDSAARASTPIPPTQAASAGEALLLCETGTGRRVAIPLRQMERLEVIDRSAVEWADGREVVQYRDGLLPLVRLGDSPAGPDEPLHVVVSSTPGRRVGLVVGRLLDTVEEPLEVRQPSRRVGCLGSVVLQQRVTDLIDLPELLRAADPELFQRVEPVGGPGR